MLQGLISFLYCFSSALLIIIILLQKGKGGLGLGGLGGGGSQMLFGGSGGQTLFQTITWAFGTILMVGGLMFSIYKYKNYKSNYLSGYKSAAQLPINSTK
jgi:preprotein translocase subunit SecG